MLFLVTNKTMLRQDASFETNTSRSNTTKCKKPDSARSVYMSFLTCKNLDLKSHMYLDMFACVLVCIRLGTGKGIMRRKKEILTEAENTE